jgi:hypothetical protein
MGEDKGDLTACMLLILVPMIVILLAVSFRDTLRSICELFDPAPIRNFIRTFRPKFSWPSYRPRFSLLTLMIVSLLLPPCVAYILLPFAVYSFKEFKYLSISDLSISMVLVLFVISLVACYFIINHMEGGPRRRWKKHLEEKSAVKELDINSP